MYLSDQEIRFALTHHQLSIDPLAQEHIQPVSVDLTLGDTYIVPQRGRLFELDDPDTWKDAGDIVPGMSQWRMRPGDFVLATTQEFVHFRSSIRGEHKERYDLWGQVHGKSTLGRLGLLVHVTAGVIDPGFHGKITLELANVGLNELILHQGMKICQITIARCGIVDHPYPRKTSKYQYQHDTTWAR